MPDFARHHAPSGVVDQQPPGGRKRASCQRFSNGLSWTTRIETSAQPRLIAERVLQFLGEQRGTARGVVPSI